MNGIQSVGGRGWLKLKFEDTTPEGGHTTDTFFESNKQGDLVITIRTTKQPSGRQYFAACNISVDELFEALSMLYPERIINSENSPAL